MKWSILDTHATIAKLVVVVPLAVVLLAVVVGTTATSVSVSTSAKLVVVSVSTTPPRGVVVVEVLTNAVVVGTKALVVVVVSRVLASPVVSGAMVDRVSMARVAPRALVDWETMMVSPSYEAGRRGGGEGGLGSVGEVRRREGGGGREIDSRPTERDSSRSSETSPWKQGKKKQEPQ